MTHGDDEGPESGGADHGLPGASLHPADVERGEAARWLCEVHRPSLPLARRSAERQRLLDQVSRRGYASGCRGLRVARSGRRFWIENGTVWQFAGAGSVASGCKPGTGAAQRHAMSRTVAVRQRAA